MAGGGALRMVLDEVLTHLHAAAPPAADGLDRPVSISGGSGGLSSPWQCQAAAAVTVMAELMFGASAAWEPPLQPPSGTAAKHAVGAVDSEMESTCLHVLQVHRCGIPVPAMSWC